MRESDRLEDEEAASFKDTNEGLRGGNGGGGLLDSGGCLLLLRVVLSFGGESRLIRGALLERFNPFPNPF